MPPKGQKKVIQMPEDVVPSATDLEQTNKELDKLQEKIIAKKQEADEKMKKNRRDATGKTENRKKKPQNPFTKSKNIVGKAKLQAERTILERGGSEANDILFMRKINKRNPRRRPRPLVQMLSSVRSMTEFAKMEAYTASRENVGRVAKSAIIQLLKYNDGTVSQEKLVNIIGMAAKNADSNNRRTVMLKDIMNAKEAMDL